MRYATTFHFEKVDAFDTFQYQLMAKARSCPDSSVSTETLPVLEYPMPVPRQIAKEWDFTGITTVTKAMTAGGGEGGPQEWLLDRKSRRFWSLCYD